MSRYQLSGRAVMNGDGECSTVAVSLGGFEAKVDWSGSKVGGHSVLVLLSPNELCKLLQ